MNQCTLRQKKETAALPSSRVDIDIQSCACTCLQVGTISGTSSRAENPDVPVVPARRSVASLETLKWAQTARPTIVLRLPYIPPFSQAMPSALNGLDCRCA